MYDYLSSLPYSEVFTGLLTNEDAVRDLTIRDPVLPFFNRVDEDDFTIPFKGRMILSRLPDPIYLYSCVHNNRALICYGIARWLNEVVLFGQMPLGIPLTTQEREDLHDILRAMPNLDIVDEFPHDIVADAIQALSGKKDVKFPELVERLTARMDIPDVFKDFPDVSGRVFILVFLSLVGYQRIMNMASVVATMNEGLFHNEQGNRDAAMSMGFPIHHFMAFPFDLIIKQLKDKEPLLSPIGSYKESLEKLDEHGNPDPAFVNFLFVAVLQTLHIHAMSDPSVALQHYFTLFHEDCRQEFRFTKLLCREVGESTKKEKADFSVLEQHKAVLPFICKQSLHDPINEALDLYPPDATYQEKIRACVHPHVPLLLNLRGVRDVAGVTHTMAKAVTSWVTGSSNSSIHFQQVAHASQWATTSYPLSNTIQYSMNTLMTRDVDPSDDEVNALYEYLDSILPVFKIYPELKDQSENVRKGTMASLLTGEVTRPHAFIKEIPTTYALIADMHMDAALSSFAVDAYGWTHLVGPMPDGSAVYAASLIAPVMTVVLADSCARMHCDPRISTFLYSTIQSSYTVPVSTPLNEAPTPRNFILLLSKQDNLEDIAEFQATALNVHGIFSPARTISLPAWHAGYDFKAQALTNGAVSQFNIYRTTFSLGPKGVYTGCGCYGGFLVSNFEMAQGIYPNPLIQMGVPLNVPHADDMKPQIQKVAAWASRQSLEIVAGHAAAACSLSTTHRPVSTVADDCKQGSDPLTYTIYSPDLARNIPEKTLGYKEYVESLFQLPKNTSSTPVTFVISMPGSAPDSSNLYRTHPYFMNLNPLDLNMTFCYFGAEKTYELLDPSSPSSYKQTDLIEPPTSSA